MTTDATERGLPLEETIHRERSGGGFATTTDYSHLPELSTEQTTAEVLAVSELSFAESGAADGDD